MDIEQELLREHSKAQALKIAAWIGTDSRRLDLLMELVLTGERVIAQRGAWVVGIIGDMHPVLLRPFLKKMIAKMKEPCVHAAVKRNFMRILQEMEIPRNLLGAVTNLCFDLLTSHKETIAVKVFSMTVIANIAQQEPGLEKELHIIVERQLPQAGPGFRSRAKKILTMSMQKG